MSMDTDTEAKDISKSENKFLRFMIFFIIALLITIISFLIFTKFWQGKILTTIGWFTTFGSLTYSQFFDIKREANFISHKEYQIGEFRPWVSKVEDCIKYFWLIGALILLLSQWVHY